MLIAEETCCPHQCLTLQQRSITLVYVFSIKLGATNPTPSTTRESSKLGFPDGALVKFPLETAVCFSGLFPHISGDQGKPGGKQTPRAPINRCLLPQSRRPGPALRSGWSHRASPRGLTGIHLARLKGLKDHLPTMGHPRRRGSSVPTLRMLRPAPRRTALCRPALPYLALANPADP